MPEGVEFEVARQPRDAGLAFHVAPGAFARGLGDADGAVVGGIGMVAILLSAPKRGLRRRHLPTACSLFQALGAGRQLPLSPAPYGAAHWFVPLALDCSPVHSKVLK